MNKAYIFHLCISQQSVSVILIIHDCLLHHIINTSFLNLILVTMLTFLKSYEMKFFIFFLWTKQNSIFIGQKIHMKFHHHYKSTKSCSLWKGKWMSGEQRIYLQTIRVGYGVDSLTSVCFTTIHNQLSFWFENQFY